jgi:cytochrome c
VDGPLLAEVEVTPTGSWATWVEKSAPVQLASVPERSDVFAVFVNPGKSGLMNLDWIQFDPPKN